MKSGKLNFLEPSGPLQVCNGTAYITNTVLAEFYGLTLFALKPTIGHDPSPVESSFSLHIFLPIT